MYDRRAIGPHVFDRRMSDHRREAFLPRPPRRCELDWKVVAPTGVLPAVDYLPLTGGCNCGAVRFEVTAPLALASYCHCKRCQRRTGAAASANAHPVPGTFRIIAGEDRLRVWTPDGGGEKWFCGDCGSSIFGRNLAHADPIGIRMGAFDADPRIRPSVRQFVSSAAAWERVPADGLPRYPQSRHTRAGHGDVALVQRRP